MFSVLIRPTGTLQPQFRPALTYAARSRFRRRASTSGVLWSAIAAVVMFIAKSGLGS